MGSCLTYCLVAHWGPLTGRGAPLAHRVPISNTPVTHLQPSGSYPTPTSAPPPLPRGGLGRQAHWLSRPPHQLPEP